MATKVEKFVKTYKSLSQIPAVVGGFVRSNGFVSSTWSQRNLDKGKTTKFVREMYTVDLLKTAEIIPVDVSSEFASFEFSPDEKNILYVAEKKPVKSEPFYKRKGPTTSNNGGNGDEEKRKGEENLFIQDWGEQMVGKKSSILVEYDIENDTVEIVKGIPDDVCIAQPKYAPDGSYVLGIAYEVNPRKLGLIYCSNRPSTLFRVDFYGNYWTLPLKNVSVKSPIFTPDGKSVIWLQRNANGPHASGMALVSTSVPLSDESTVKVIVDTVQSEKKINDGKIFYGLYNTGFRHRPWASGNRLLINTNQKYTISSYAINIDSGEISQLEFEDGSQLVLDIYNDTVLAVQRNFLKPDKLVIGKLPPAGSESTIVWNNLSESKVVEGFENCSYKYLDLTVAEDSVGSFNAIYVGPQGGDDKSVPLIVWPHGGPHSAFANYLILEASMFLSFGYAVLLINYRGSLGSGQKSVEFLLGKIGTADVDDCIIATDSAIQSFPWLNPNAVVLVGGSHGGFLVAHLSGQYPDKYKAVVARNPVIDVASMSVISDIPDWCYAEAGKEYTQQGEIDNEILATMRKVSPIVHAHKVKAPTLLQIGSKDLRVPPHQGTEYYFRLKANGVVTRLNLYDDNHPIGSVPNEMDNIINTLLWADEHLGIKS